MHVVYVAASAQMVSILAMHGDVACFWQSHMIDNLPGLPKIKRARALVVIYVIPHLPFANDLKFPFTFFYQVII